jgi:ABC-2 type transport system permease protein
VSAAKVLAIAGNNLRLTSRDRSALFFSIVMPVVIIVIIGATFGTGGGSIDIGWTGGTAGAGGELAERLDAAPSVEVRHYPDVDAARSALLREEVSAVVVVPDAYDADLGAGRPTALTVLADPVTAAGRELHRLVTTAATAQATPVAAAGVLSAELGGDTGTHLEAVRAVAAGSQPVGVESAWVGERAGDTLSPFSYTAPSNLVLFVFLNSLAVGAGLIETRRLRVSHRMLASPTSAGTVVAGEAAGRLLFAVLQSALIVVVGALLFGVNWGDPVAVAALVLVFALVGAAGGLLISAVADNVELAGAVAIPVGLVAGMLGGTMWPLEVVPPIMRTIGHAVPHAWAMDAWQALIFDGAGLGGILTELAVLAAFAAVLAGLATVLFRRAVLRPAH